MTALEAMLRPCQTPKCLSLGINCVFVYKWKNTCNSFVHSHLCIQVLIDQMFLLCSLIEVIVLITAFKIGKIDLVSLMTT